ncbi:MAG: hypothetical protein O2783_00115 [Chloroflexi bacterium]|nr:hypothetical protein [Chloroflexota bacterium]
MTLSRLRPLDVKFLFNDRAYKLGETINVMLELGARGEVEVREARLDLVCDEHYVESYTVNVPVGPRADAGAPPGLGGLYSSATVPKEVHKDIKESYVHSGEVFLTNSWLRSSAVNQYSVRLSIGTERPPHASIATVKWRLELVVDVARARDVRARHKVNVLLS